MSYYSQCKFGNVYTKRISFLLRNISVWDPFILNNQFIIKQLFIFEIIFTVEIICFRMHKPQVTYKGLFFCLRCENDTLL